MSVGERIKEIRKKRGYTQKELAEKSGIATVSIQQYERGVRQPRIDQLQSLSTALGASISYLLGGEDEDTVSSIYLACGVHIYRNIYPFKVIEQFLTDPQADSCDILYQDEYLIIAVEQTANVTTDVMEDILRIYAPHAILESSSAKQVFAEMESGVKIQLDKAFEQLNFLGKHIAMERVQELSKIPEYRAQPAPQSPSSPQEGTDTTPPENAPETPPEGE